jgi:hypothetical protein
MYLHPCVPSNTILPAHRKQFQKNARDLRVRGQSNCGSTWTMSQRKHDILQRCGGFKMSIPKQYARVPISRMDFLVCDTIFTTDQPILGREGYCFGEKVGSFQRSFVARSTEVDSSSSSVILASSPCAIDMPASYCGSAAIGQERPWASNCILR